MSASGVTVMPRPSVVRPITPVQSAKVHVVAPAKFSDAQEIGAALALQPERRTGAGPEFRQQEGSRGIFPEA